MGIWTLKVEPEIIAQTVDSALTNALSNASSGSLDNQTIEPLIRSAIFSDSILLYSPDSTWASLAILCSKLRTLLSIALTEGAPIRGTISVGLTVVDQSRSLYIGQPLHDAYETDKNMAYRGVGVQMTNRCVKYIEQTLMQHRVPLGFAHDQLSEFWTGEYDKTNLLVRHMGEVLINQWWGPFFKVMKTADKAIEHLRECFYKRSLPIDSEVDNKFGQTKKFLYRCCFRPQTIEAMTERTKKEWKRSMDLNKKMTEECESYESELIRLQSILRDE